jgi:hypothetical protein
MTSCDVRECNNCKETKDTKEFYQYKTGKNKGQLRSFCKKRIL